jgi:hypothetical protein
VIVDAALKKTGGNKQATAKLLGVYRPRVYSLIKKHQLMGAPVSSQSKQAATAPENGGSSEEPQHEQETLESAGPGETEVNESAASPLAHRARGLVG